MGIKLSLLPGEITSGNFAVSHIMYIVDPSEPTESDRSKKTTYGDLETSILTLSGKDVVFVGGTFSGNFVHTGTNIGFYGVTPVARQSSIADTTAESNINANTVNTTNADTVTSADADATYGAEEQALINELKTDYNAAVTLINELKTDYNVAVTLINSLKTNYNDLQDKFDTLKTSVTTIGIIGA